MKSWGYARSARPRQAALLANADVLPVLRRRRARVKAIVRGPLCWCGLVRRAGACSRGFKMPDGDQGHRLSYQELGEAFRCKAKAHLDLITRETVELLLTPLREQ